MTQVRTLLVTSRTALAMEESRLCVVSSIALVINPPDQAIQLQAETGVQLNLAKLPHNALQGLHTVVFQEIRHRDQQVHQQLGVVE